MNSAKFSPRCGERAFWNSKSKKVRSRGVFGGSKCFAQREAQGLNVAGAGVREVFKNVGRRGGGGFEGALYGHAKEKINGENQAKPCLGARKLRRMHCASFGGRVLQATAGAIANSDRSPWLGSG